MAVLHGIGGEWARSEADKRWRRHLSLIITFSILYGVALGFIVSYLPRWYIALPLLGVFAVVSVPTMRLLDKPLHAIARERIKYLRGAQAEGLVAWILKDMEEGWHVFNGMKLVEHWDIDHVVVGPGGLFCVQTKAWRGLLEAGKDGRLYRNHEATDVLAEAVSQGMRLRERLAALLGADVPWVQAVVAAPLAWVEGPVRQGNVMVVHQDNMVQSIDDGKKRLEKREVERCVKALEMLQGTAKGIWRG